MTNLFFQQSDFLLPINSVASAFSLLKICKIPFYLLILQD